MSYVILSFFIILFFVLVLKEHSMCAHGEEETITTTVTTTEEPELNIVGNLKRQVEGIQSFVIDPVDKQKIFLNSNDDMYEDAAGKIWRLV